MRHSNVPVPSQARASSSANTNSESCCQSSTDLTKLCCAVWTGPMAYSMAATSLGGAVLRGAGWAVLSAPQLATVGAVGGAITVSIYLLTSIDNRGTPRTCPDVCIPPSLLVTTGGAATLGARALGYTRTSQVCYAASSGFIGGIEICLLMYIGGYLYYAYKDRDRRTNQVYPADQIRVGIVQNGVNNNSMDMDQVLHQIQIQHENPLDRYENTTSLPNFIQNIEKQGIVSGVNVQPVVQEINNKVKTLDEPQNLQFKSKVMK